MSRVSFLPRNNMASQIPASYTKQMGLKSQNLWFNKQWFTKNKSCTSSTVAYAAHQAQPDTWKLHFPCCIFVTSDNCDYDDYETSYEPMYPYETWKWTPIVLACPKLQIIINNQDMSFWNHEGFRFHRHLGFTITSWPQVACRSVTGVRYQWKLRPGTCLAALDMAGCPNPSCRKHDERRCWLFIWRQMKTIQSNVKWKSYTMVLLLILVLVFLVIDVVSNTAWVSPTEFWTHEDVAAPPLLLLETVQNHKSWQNSPGGNSIFKTTKINPTILGYTVYTHCGAAICKALPLVEYSDLHIVSKLAFKKGIYGIYGDVMEVAR